MPLSNRDPWNGATRVAGWRRLREEQAEAMRDSLNHVARHTLRTGFVWLALAVALAIPSVFVLLGDGLAVLTRDQAEQLQASIYLLADLGEERSATVAQRIGSMPEVEAWTTTSPEAALRELENTLGADLDGALGGENPLPMRLDVTLRATAGDEAQLRFVDRVRTLPEVDAVVAEWRWRERVREVLSLFQRFAWVLGLLLAAGAVMVAHASVRMAVESRISEIQVFVLLGADRGTVRRPFTWLGVLYGAGGGLLAAMMVSAILLIIEPALQRLLASYGTVTFETGFGFGFSLLLLLAGTLLGLLGAVLAAREGTARAEQIDVW